MGVVYTSFFPNRQREYILIISYIILCLVYVIFGIRSSSKLLKVILKCAPVFLLLAFIIYVTSKLNLGPIQGKGNAVDLERVIFGLIFSFLGDFYLVFDLLFLLGIISFAAAQLTYINLFGGWTLLYFSFSVDYNEIITAVAIALVSALVYFYILQKLSWVLVIPAALYCVLLSVMLWCALVSLQRDPSLPAILGAVGACLFYTSDLLLAVSRWRLNIPCGPYIIITTYYASQLLIFLHVIHKF